MDTVPRTFRRTQLSPVRVVLSLDTQRIEGTIHVDPARTRFSDAWDALLHDRRSYVAVTDAKVVDIAGEGPVRDVSFMLVDKGDVVSARPVEEMAATGLPVRRSEVTPLPVGLVLQGLVIEGTIHVPPGKNRFSESWESLLREHRSFVPVTDAKIWAEQAPESKGSALFCVVEKQEIQAAYPLGNGHTDSSAVRRLPRESAQAVIMLDNFRIEGTVHMEPSPPGFSRFSDGWDALMRDRRSFLAVTDATIETTDDQKLARTEFIVIDKANIRAAYPAA